MIVRNNEEPKERKMPPQADMRDLETADVGVVMLKQLPKCVACGKTIKESEIIYQCHRRKEIFHHSDCDTPSNYFVKCGTMHFHEVVRIELGDGHAK
jgi:NAD-dependent SIR2 family protein deacetylase